MGPLAYSFSMASTWLPCSGLLKSTSMISSTIVPAQWPRRANRAAATGHYARCEQLGKAH